MVSEQGAKIRQKPIRPIPSAEAARKDREGATGGGEVIGFSVLFPNLAPMSARHLIFSALPAQIRKDFRLEFRQRIMTATLILFVGSACFTLYQVTLGGRTRVGPQTWNAFFWLILLFSSFQVVQRGFVREAGYQFWYYLFRVPPGLLMTSKLLFHTIMLQISGLITWLVLGTLFGNPVSDSGLFMLILLLSCTGIAGSLTLVSAISARAGKNATLLPVLGFPLLIPVLLLGVRGTIPAIEGLGWDMAWKTIGTLSALDAVTIALSFVLFPYLWRS